MANLNNKLPVHNDSGKHLVLALGGAAVGPGSGGIGDVIPASPVFGHTGGKPYYIKGGFVGFNGNGGIRQQTPFGHGLPALRFVAVSVSFTPVGFFGQPSLYQATDISTVYVEWLAANTSLGQSTLSGSLGFTWTLLAQEGV